MPNAAKGKIRQKFPNFILQNFDKQIAPCESTSREVSFEWLLHRTLSTDSKVRTTLQNSIIHSGSERVTENILNSPLALSCILVAMCQRLFPFPDEGYCFV